MYLDKRFLNELISLTPICCCFFLKNKDLIRLKKFKKKSNKSKSPTWILPRRL